MNHSMNSLMHLDGIAQALDGVHIQTAHINNSTRSRHQTPVTSEQSTIQNRQGHIQTSIGLSSLRSNHCHRERLWVTMQYFRRKFAMAMCCTAERIASGLCKRFVVPCPGWLDTTQYRHSEVRKMVWILLVHAGCSPHYPQGRPRSHFPTATLALTGAVCQGLGNVARVDHGCYAGPCDVILLLQGKSSDPAITVNLTKMGMSTRLPYVTYRHLEKVMTI